MDTNPARLAADCTRFEAELGGIPCITDPAVVRQKSRDFFWYSPILKAQLDHKMADIVVCPRTENEVVTVAVQCARWRVPLTLRGGGTGNYGQAVDEYTRNHTTLHALRRDKTVTYLRTLFSADRQLEFIRVGSRVTCRGLSVVRYTTEAWLNEIVAFHESRRVLIADPHALLNPGKMRSYVSSAA